MPFFLFKIENGALVNNMRRHITKKKTHFSVSIIALIAVIIVGSFILDKTQVFSFDYIRQELSYLKYKKAIEGELNNEEVLVKATEIPV